MNWGLIRAINEHSFECSQDYLWSLAVHKIILLRYMRGKIMFPIAVFHEAGRIYIDHMKMFVHINIHVCF